MFIFSFKASSVKILCLLCACLIGGALVIALMPEAGYAVNVNKLAVHSSLDDISVKSAKGRTQYLEALGFEIEEKPHAVSSSTVPKTFDASLEQYNLIQRSQGFDLTKYKGKDVKSYTYKVTNLPDGTKLGDDTVLATLIIYKNKVIGADICCEETGQVSEIIKTA